MSKFAAELFLARKTVEVHVDEGPAHIQSRWRVVEPLMDQWFTTYKMWERHDGFNTAYCDRRMSVRTFPGPNPEKLTSFDDQVNKYFARGSISLKNGQEVRVYADGSYTPIVDPQAITRHDRAFHNSNEKDKYWAQRGIDSSYFADPANFAERNTKYELGLHDLSASLLNPKLSIFDQVHNSDVGAHFSFLPLSKEEDQLLLYKMVQCAKPLKTTLAQFHNKVRDFRAKITRVKLANEFDMAVGYSAVPVANPVRGTPAYKLRYGLTSMTTVIGPNGQESVAVTPQLLERRRQTALRFKSILGIRDAKNEIVIAIRQHAGPFPVYAIRTRNDELECYTIGEVQVQAVDDEGTNYTYMKKTMALNGRRISKMGWMT